VRRDEGSESSYQIRSCWNLETGKPPADRLPRARHVHVFVFALDSQSCVCSGLSLESPWRPSAQASGRATSVTSQRVSSRLSCRFLETVACVLSCSSLPALYLHTPHIHNISTLSPVASHSCTLRRLWKPQSDPEYIST
jgi:hypothetical protein